MGCGASTQKKYTTGNQNVPPKDAKDAKPLGGEMDDDFAIGERLSRRTIGGPPTPKTSVPPEEQPVHSMPEEDHQQPQQLQPKKSIMFDTVGDGKVNLVRVDTLGLGRHDTVLTDTKGDGKMNRVLKDTTGEGKVNMILHDTTGDGKFDLIHEDTRGDGKITRTARDTNADGNIDHIEEDTMGTGRVNRIEKDTTGNGFRDTVEIDTTGDGNLDMVIKVLPPSTQKSTFLSSHSTIFEESSEG